MTHTLHRTHHVSGGPGDYIVFSMAAQGFNNAGAAEKLRTTLKILLKHGPVNAGDDNLGGVLTGPTVEEILAHAGEKSYMAAVYDSKDKAQAALEELKAANLGLSVVVTGNREAIFRMLDEIRMKPHTVNLSLGCFGKTEKLPPAEILDITTMCGHGMVCPDHVSHVIRRVRAGRMTPEEAALDLAKPCTCAMFNPSRAAHLIAAICDVGADNTKQETNEEATKA